MKCPNVDTISILNPRGDYKSISIRLGIPDTDPKQYYEPTENEDMFFTIKDNFSKKEEYVIQKSLNEGTITFNKETKYFTFELNKEDTINLEYKKYVGDIKIIKDGDEPQTIAYVELVDCFDATNSTLDTEE